MKRKYRFVICITLFVYLFSVFSYPKKAEAIGGEIGLWLGGTALTGTSIGAIGTAVGVLGVAGLAVVAGTGLYYLGKDLYDHWYSDRVLNSDGSVTVNDKMLESTQNFIDNYDVVASSPIDSRLVNTPGFIGNLNTVVNGEIVSGAFASLYVSHVTMNDTYHVVPVNSSFHIKAASDGLAEIIFTSMIMGQVFEQKFSTNRVANADLVFELINVEQNWYSNTRRLALTYYFNLYENGVKVWNNMQVAHSPGHLKSDVVMGEQFVVGVRSVSAFPVNPLENDTGSISINPPAINTGSISAQRVVEQYGRDAILYTPKEWVNTVPMNPSISVNPSIVVPGTIPAVQEVAEPITYPVEENPSIPGDVPYVPDLSLPGSVSLDFTPLYINLTNKFPFSLPWDMANLFHSFTAPPVAPKFNVKFDEQYFLGGGEFDIDFNRFSKIAAILKFFVLISFVIMLIKLTRNMIGG